MGDSGEDREDPLHYVLHEAHRLQVEETIETLAEGLEWFYG